MFASLACLFALFSNSLIFGAAEVNEAEEGAVRGLSVCKQGTNTSVIRERPPSVAPRRLKEKKKI